jgi:1,4-dihydroxy-2-naphthoate octaprenyltransferase
MRHWIEAARIRTLPLSVSGIIVGSMRWQIQRTTYLPLQRCLTGEYLVSQL